MSSYFDSNPSGIIFSKTEVKALFSQIQNSLSDIKLYKKRNNKNYTNFNLLEDMINFLTYEQEALSKNKSYQDTRYKRIQGKLLINFRKI